MRILEKERKRSAPSRPRNATATRAAILASAKAAFARAGYDGAGVREIAEGAGVTAMLVNRYFGSKEKLFAEVAAETMATPIILSPEALASPARAELMATALVHLTSRGATPLDGFRIMLHSAASRRAAAIGREQIEKHHLATLAKALSGSARSERAAVFLALVAGLQVMRQTIGLSALAEAKPKTLIKILTPLMQQLVDGD